jgi:hypothetical protein
MPKVVVSHSKGLVQESGTGVSFTPDATLTSGLHLHQEVFDFTGVTITDTDNGLLKYSSKKLPANGNIVFATAEVIEKLSADEAAITVSLTADGAEAEGAAPAAPADIVGLLQAGQSGDVGDVVALADPADIGSNVFISILNADNGNSANHVCTAGKVLVSLMVAGAQLTDK